MKTDLAIIGQGAVTPAGLGVEPLLLGKTSPVVIEELSAPGQGWPVLRVDLKHPRFVRWQREPRLRRASPVTFFLVEAAAQALGDASSEDCAQTGLIVAYCAGCLMYSRRFFEQIVRQGQRAASPALFPETVFNSPASHVAAVLGLSGAAYALVGDEAAWVSAVITASIWLKEERVKQVLVLGADEFDALALDAYRSVRWLRRTKSPAPFLTSEGAAGLLLRAAGPNDTARITRATDGFIYRTKAEAVCAAQEMIGACDPNLPAFRTAEHNWLGPIEDRALRHRPLAPSAPYLGEAFAASAAWRTLQAAALLSPALRRRLVPAWGLNHQFGSLELTTAK